MGDDKFEQGSSSPPEAPLSTQIQSELAAMKQDIKAMGDTPKGRLHAPPKSRGGKLTSRVRSGAGDSIEARMPLVKASWTSGGWNLYNREPPKTLPRAFVPYRQEDEEYQEHAKGFIEKAIQWKVELHEMKEKRLQAEARRKASEQQKKEEDKMLQKTIRHQLAVDRLQVQIQIRDEIARQRLQADARLRNVRKRRQNDGLLHEKLAQTWEEKQQQMEMEKFAQYKELQGMARSIRPGEVMHRPDLHPVMKEQAEKQRQLVVESRTQRYMDSLHPTWNPETAMHWSLHGSSTMNHTCHAPRRTTQSMHGSTRTKGAKSSQSPSPYTSNAPTLSPDASHALNLSPDSSQISPKAPPAAVPSHVEEDGTEGGQGGKLSEAKERGASQSTEVGLGVQSIITSPGSNPLQEGQQQQQQQRQQQQQQEVLVSSGSEKQVGGQKNEVVGEVEEGQQGNDEVEEGGLVEEEDDDGGLLGEESKVLD